MTIRLYEDPNGGAPAPISSLNLIYSETFQIGALAGVVFNAPLTQPQTFGCQSTVVVEIHTPDGQPNQNSFFMGSNNAGQSSPSFISSTACSINEPTDLASIGFANNMYVINAVYSPGNPCSPCSGVPVDCHDPLFGSYSIRGIQSDNFGSSPGSALTHTLLSTTDTISVSGQPAVADLDVYFNATHAYVGDLDITLESPLGTSVQLHDNTGVNLQDFDCIYDDAGRLNARPYNDGSRMMPSGPGTLG